MTLDFFPEHLDIFVESSKTDQYRDGAVAVIACTGTACCPVAMLECYIELTGMSKADQSESFLFRCLVNTKNGQRLRDLAPLSYTRAQEVVLDMLEAVGLDRKRFIFHSLRAGGASAAANAGVATRQIL